MQKTNNMTDLYTIMHGVLEDETNRFDQLLATADDGSGRGVDDSKDEAIAELDITIVILTQMKEEIRSKSMKSLRKSYKIEEAVS